MLVCKMILGNVALCTPIQKEKSLVSFCRRNEISLHFAVNMCYDFKVDEMKQIEMMVMHFKDCITI